MANRNREEVEGLIGFFVNTLVLRTEIERGIGVGGSCWSRCREVTLEAYEHQDVPFEKLVEELQPERDLSRTPLFQVMLVLQNLGMVESRAVGNGGEQLELVGVKLEPLDFESEAVAAKFDLMLLVGESGEGIEGLLEYNTDLFDRETVERMVRRWELVLEQVVEMREGGQHVGEIALLTAEERRQVAEEWSGTEVKLVER